MGNTICIKILEVFFEILRVYINLSSAFHPQTDGQTQHVNQLLKQYLRNGINY